MPSDTPAPVIAQLWAVWVHGEGWMRPRPGADIFVAWSEEAAVDAAVLFCGYIPGFRGYLIVRFDESLKDFEAVILEREKLRDGFLKTQEEKTEREREETRRIILEAQARAEARQWWEFWKA